MLTLVACVIVVNQFPVHDCMRCFRDSDVTPRQRATTRPRAGDCSDPRGAAQPTEARADARENCDGEAIQLPARVPSPAAVGSRRTDDDDEKSAAVHQRGESCALTCLPRQNVNGRQKENARTISWLWLCTCSSIQGREEELEAATRLSRTSELARV